MRRAKAEDARGTAPIWARGARELGGKGLAIAIGLGGCAAAMPDAGAAEEDGTLGQDTTASYAQSGPAQPTPATTPATTPDSAPVRPAGAPVASDYPEPAEPEDVESAIAQHLARLDQLAIVEVGGLVMQLPYEASSCYGGPPCAGYESTYADERARQAPRLSALTAIAEQVAQGETPQSAPYATADQALEALRALQIVEVTGLVQSEPQNNPLCYSLPCAEDIARADAENERRVAQALAIADAAQRVKL